MDRAAAETQVPHEPARNLRKEKNEGDVLSDDACPVQRCTVPAHWAPGVLYPRRRPRLDRKAPISAEARAITGIPCVITTSRQYQRRPHNGIRKYSSDDDNCWVI